MNNEEWTRIREFPNYEVSSLGNVRRVGYSDPLALSLTNHGHVKISLQNERGRFTRSVALLVAQAFIEAPNYLSDTVIILNGDLEDVRACNLAWRTNGFSWKYVRQLKTEPPTHYRVLPVLNEDTGIEYGSIVEAGLVEGLLFKDIWRSTYSGANVYPYQHTFKIIERV